MLEHICNSNSSKPVRKSESEDCLDDIFRTKVASVSLQDYSLRLSYCFDCSPECFVIAMIYLSRLLAATSLECLRHDTVHRLLLTSLTVATKFHSDDHYVNEVYAQAGGVKLRHLNELEAAFLKRLGWNVSVSPQEFNDCVATLCLLRHKDCESQCTQQCKHGKGGGACLPRSSSLGPFLSYLDLPGASVSTEPDANSNPSWASADSALPAPGRVPGRFQAVLNRTRCCFGSRGF
jgi:hypothetical protein